jgi:hypothetical protein
VVVSSQVTRSQTVANAFETGLKRQLFVLCSQNRRIAFETGLKRQLFVCDLVPSSIPWLFFSLFPSPVSFSFLIATVEEQSTWFRKRK